MQRLIGSSYKRAKYLLTSKRVLNLFQSYVCLQLPLTYGINLE